MLDFRGVYIYAIIYLFDIIFDKTCLFQNKFPSKTVNIDTPIDAILESGDAISKPIIFRIVKFRGGYPP